MPRTIEWGVANPLLLNTFLFATKGIGAEVGERPRGRAGLHRRPGHGRRDFRDQARIEGLGDQLLRTEGQVLDATTVGRGKKFALLLPCQLGDGRAERCARQLGRPHAGEVRARPGFGSFIRTCRPIRYCMC